MSYEAKIVPIERYGLINIRADFSAQRVIGESLGHELPVTAHTAVHTENFSVLCFSEDQWWVRCNLEQETDLFNQLYDLNKHNHCAATIISDHFSGFSLIGTDARKVLRQGVSIDLDDYASGQCTRSGFARCGASIQIVEQYFHYDLFVESSYASYVNLWFDAARKGVQNSQSG